MASTTPPSLQEYDLLSLFIDHPFLQMALFGALLASFASGAIGSFVVVKRISFLAGSISHSVLGGMGFFLWLQKRHGLIWADPLLGALFAAIASALLIGWIHLRYRQREDAVIGAIWSTGMAIGVIFLSLTPAANGELLNFLFGNILWVSSQDLLWLTLLDLAILATLALSYRRLIALCFDEELALLQGVSVQRLYLLLLSLIALSVVLLIQVIGTILVLALLTLPATIASLWTHRFLPLIALSIALSSLFSLLGLNLSYLLDWPPGATIALLAAAAYLSTLAFKRVAVK